MLEQHPEMGPPMSLASKLDLRRFPIDGFPKYLLYYSPIKSGIRVVRVVHGARDLSSMSGDKLS